MNFKYKVKKDKLIIEIPLWQTWYDVLDEPKGKVNNLYGVIAGDEYTLSQAIALGYKDDVQEGMPILHFSSKEELLKLCKKAKIPIVEHHKNEEYEERNY